MSDRVNRLREIAGAIADGNRDELTMRVPAEPDRDADLVVSWAADEIGSLRRQVSAAYGMAIRKQEEIDRLRVSVRQADERGDEAMRRAHAAEADNERLRGLLREARDELSWAECTPDTYEEGCPECATRVLRDRIDAALSAVQPSAVAAEGVYCKWCNVTSRPGETSCPACGRDSTPVKPEPDCACAEIGSRCCPVHGNAP
jgi:hypothetical protein